MFSLWISLDITLIFCPTQNSAQGGRKGHFFRLRVGLAPGGRWLFPVSIKALEFIKVLPKSVYERSISHFHFS